MRFLSGLVLSFLFATTAAFSQDACQALQELAAARTTHFKSVMDGEITSPSGNRQYRSKVILPGFDQNYLELSASEPAYFNAKIIGYPDLNAAGKALDSLLQQWSSCLRGYTFYKEENCSRGCHYFVSINESNEVLFYAGYQLQPEEGWYTILLTMPGGAPMALPAGLTRLKETHPPLELPTGNLDACQTLQLYLKASANRFQDLLAPDGTLKVKYPESLHSEVLSNGTARIVLAVQTGDEDTQLDEAYLITQSAINHCLTGWSQLELMREDDADFLNDRKWIKGNQTISLTHEISKGGKGRNRLLLEISVR